MPTYQYLCSLCGQTFETSQSITDDPLSNCLDPVCGGEGTLERLIGSGGGFIFKGSGFYANDYKKSPVAAPSSKDDSSPKPSDQCEQKSACGKAAAGKCPADG